MNCIQDLNLSLTKRQSFVERNGRHLILSVSFQFKTVVLVYFYVIINCVKTLNKHQTHNILMEDEIWLNVPTTGGPH